MSLPGGFEPPLAGAARPERPAPPTAPAAREYAGWGQRLGSVLIDMLIVLIPFFVLGFIAAAVIVADNPNALDEQESGGTLDVALTIASTVISYLYYGLTMGRRGAHNGQSIGKQVVGIRVVREDGRPVSIAFGALRELLKGVLGAITLGINYLWPLWDARNQALHDKVARTLVVKA